MSTQALTPYKLSLVSVSLSADYTCIYHIRLVGESIVREAKSM